MIPILIVHLSIHMIIYKISYDVSLETNDICCKAYKIRLKNMIIQTYQKSQNNVNYGQNSASIS